MYFDIISLKFSRLRYLGIQKLLSEIDQLHEYPGTNFEIMERKHEKVVEELRLLARILEIENDMAEMTKGHPTAEFLRCNISFNTISCQNLEQDCAEFFTQSLLYHVKGTFLTFGRQIVQFETKCLWNPVKKDSTEDKIILNEVEFDELSMKMDEWMSENLLLPKELSLSQEEVSIIYEMMWGMAET